VFSMLSSCIVSAYPSQFIASSAGAPIWRSTGLYAKAGTVVTLQFTDVAVGKLMVSFIMLNIYV
jgi:hypothetical protein